MKMPGVLKPVILAAIRAIPPLERRLIPSAGYRKLDKSELGTIGLTAGWKSPRSAQWQQATYDGLMAELVAGRPRRDFEIAAHAVDTTALQRPSLLEVGCGGGYHSAVFARLCASEPRYRGSDFSPAMVESARQRYAGVPFEVADATALPYASESFDIVFDGVALMHIPEFEAAIREIARVARSYAIFHCVPVFDNHSTTWLFKYAYGEPTSEVVFDRRELEALFASNGLTVVESWDALPYDVVRTVGAHSHSRTYVCRKGPMA
jgi:SAM-dependent methyltransferase